VTRSLDRSPRDDLVELVVRHFSSQGPATVADFA
jgi:hypothetical protein